MNQNQVNPKKIKAAGRIIRDQLILSVIAVPAAFFLFKGAAGLVGIIGVIMLFMTARLSYLLMTCDEEENDSALDLQKKEDFERSQFIRTEKNQVIRKRKKSIQFSISNMYKLTNKSNQQVIGTISGTQMQFLVDHLEEESLKDKDYWLHKSLLNTFQENGADPELILLLTAAFGENEELDIVWEKI